MFKTKVKCPYCGHHFTYSIFGFNRTVICEQCKKKIFVETKSSMYMLLFLVFLLASDYVRDAIETALPNQSEMIYFIVMFAITIVALLLVMFVLIKLFGFTSVYRIRDEEFYKDAVQQANANKAKRQANKKKRK